METLLIEEFMIIDYYYIPTQILFYIILIPVVFVVIPFFKTWYIKLKEAK